MGDTKILTHLYGTFGALIFAPIFTLLTIVFLVSGVNIAFTIISGVLSLLFIMSFAVNLRTLFVTSRQVFLPQIHYEENKDDE